MGAKRTRGRLTNTTDITMKSKYPLGFMVKFIVKAVFIVIP